jgi:signal transduction histidine kinase
MSKPSLSTSPLSAVAQALLPRREAIVQRWFELAEADPELTAMSTLSRAQFRDHIPELLEAFTLRLAALRPADPAEAGSGELQSAESHGLVRWQQGYQQRELMRECRHLHLVLIDEMEALAGAEQFDPPALAHARRELALLASDGVCESATQYAILQRAEASARMRDLEQGLAEFKESQVRQAQIWREATHDLRGGLGVVQQATAVLKRALPDAASVVAMAERGVASMQTLLNDLIGLARLEAGQEQRQLAQFDGGALLHELGTTLLPIAAARNLRLLLEGPRPLPVEGDAVKVRRIAQNLLLNALRYTARGGVVLRWDAVSGEGIPRWSLTVQDTGPGIGEGNSAPIAQALKDATDESLAVTDMPRQSEESEPAVLSTQHGVPPEQPPGEGIGLSIVKRLCELLDAHLELHTERGKGSTFRVILPAIYR